MMQACAPPLRDARQAGAPRAVSAAASARRLLLALILIVPVALVVGSIAGFAIGRVSTPPSSYRDQRIGEVEAELQRAAGDYLLATGDSHVARWQARELCGLPVVNAGVEGATAADTDALLADLVLPRPPRAIILTVGTNDANRKRFRDPPEAVIRFRNAFRPLLRRLAQKTDLVFVTGLPPIDPAKVSGFSPEARAAIDLAAQASCKASASCSVAGPLSDAAPLVDGLHLADYERAYQRIAPSLCAALAAKPTLASSR